MDEDERDHGQPAVLPARKALPLIGEEPAERESSGDEAAETGVEVVGDRERPGRS